MRGAPRWRPSGEIGAADWLTREVRTFAKDVGSLLPQGFESYARIFHPAYDRDRELRWAEAANRSGRTVHSQMQFHAIAPCREGPGGVNHPGEGLPHTGRLTEGQIAALVPMLAGATSAPEACWFCLWEGYGSVAGERRARVRLPHRNYLLFEGPVNAAATFLEAICQTPNLWWPADRRWCVASEIDLESTYVGGSRELIEGILARPALEALPCAITDGITEASDTVNV